MQPDEWMWDGEKPPRSAVEYAPKEITAKLTECGIVGQDAAKKAASIILYNHTHGTPSVSVFCGPSGCGKTELWNIMRDEFGERLVVIHDASTITAEGWKGGNKISGILKSLWRPDDDAMRRDKRAHSILVLDEFDKCLEPQYGSGGTNYSDIVQGQLLRLFAHDDVFVGDENTGKGAYMNCSALSIVCLGAFQRLLEQKSEQSGGIGFGATPRTRCTYADTEITQEDLVAYGMRAELAGRVDRIVCMEPLTVDMLAQIGRQMIEDIREVWLPDICMPEHTLTELARIAAGKEFGARWIKSKIRSMIDDLIYEDPDRKDYNLECPEMC